MPDDQSRVINVPSLLEWVRHRPAMYIGQKSIYGLNMMLGGIEFAESIHKIAPDKRFSGFDFTRLEARIDQRYNIERGSFRSFSLAAFIAGSDVDGFDLWYQWYDEFLGLELH